MDKKTIIYLILTASILISFHYNTYQRSQYTKEIIKSIEEMKDSILMELKNETR